MKTHIFLFKFLCLTILSLDIQPGYAQEAVYATDYSPTHGSLAVPSFGFLFAESIASVQFIPTKFSDKAYSEDGSGAPLESKQFSFLINNTKYQFNISITSGINGSFGTANDFNHKFGASRDEEFMHTFEVLPLKDNYSHTPAIATNQNFWIEGALYIESKLVSNNFVIGHNGSSDKNWWVGTLDGNRFDTPTNSGINLQSEDGNKFCLSQYKTNYQLVVSNGPCTAHPVIPLYQKGHLKRTILITLVVTGSVVAVVADPELAALIVEGDATFLGNEPLFIPAETPEGFIGYGDL